MHFSFSHDKAIDGLFVDRNSNFYHAPYRADLPWFQLDMAMRHQVGKVILDTRRHCCNEREVFLEVIGMKNIDWGYFTYS